MSTLCWNLPAVCETSVLCMFNLSPLPSLSSSFSSLFCFLQPAWFLMVGGDRNFKLALKEEDEEFSDELREDCEVRGEKMRGEGEGIPVTEVVSTHYINSVCWNGREGRGGERMRRVDRKGGKRGRGGP